MKSSCLSPSSMVRMVFSVYRGAIRIPKELLPAVEMDFGQYSYLIYNPFFINAHVMSCAFHFSDDSVIRTVDGKILHKYKHPAAVFGCDWSQNNK